MLDARQPFPTRRPPAPADVDGDWRFDALAARIAAHFIARFDTGREACWIAERDGPRRGRVFGVQARDDVTGTAGQGVAQRRMRLVEPAARGLYTQAGDRRVASQPHQRFGHALVGEVRELAP
jgi:hypothetical protein